MTRKLYYRTFTLYLRELAEENNQELHGLLFIHKLTRITRKLLLSFIYVPFMVIYVLKPQITLIARISLRELHANYYYRLFTFHLRSFTLKKLRIKRAYVFLSYHLFVFLSNNNISFCLNHVLIHFITNHAPIMSNWLKSTLYCSFFFKIFVCFIINF